jgi:hypothetical protein
VLGIAGLALALLAARAALENLLASRPNPALLALSGNGPRLAILTVDPLQLFQAKVPVGRRADAADKARDLLRAEPLEPYALWLLSASLAEPAKSAELLALSERISRRDSMTQLGLMQDAAKRGDLAGAFRHLDRTLVVNPEVAPLIFPQMVNAIADPTFRAEVRRAGMREWYPEFFQLAAERTNHTREVAALVGDLPPFEPRVRDLIVPPLLGKLLGAGDYASAKRLAARTGAAEAGAADRFGFDRATTEARLAPLTWRLANDENAAAALDDAGVIAIEVLPGQSTVALERYFAARPGTYRFTQRSEIDFEAALEARWEIDCAGRDGESVFRRIQVSNAPGVQRLVASVTIPANCPVQTWRLKLSAFDSQVPVLIRLGPVAFAPQTARADEE